MQLNVYTLVAPLKNTTNPSTYGMCLFPDRNCIDITMYELLVPQIIDSNCSFNLIWTQIRIYQLITPQTRVKKG